MEKDLIDESIVKHRMLYKKNMVELKSIFKCNICKRLPIDGIWYRSGCILFSSKLSSRYIYCSKMCRVMSGMGGGIAYSN
jgi:hypothetical protein